MLSIYGLAAIFLFCFGIGCAAVAVLMGNNIPALLAIAGLAGSGLMAIADTLDRSYHPAISRKEKGENRPDKS
jgi:hypothetical protein